MHLLSLFFIFYFLFFIFYFLFFPFYNIHTRTSPTKCERVAVQLNFLLFVLFVLLHGVGDEIVMSWTVFRGGVHSGAVESFGVDSLRLAGDWTDHGSTRRTQRAPFPIPT